MGTRPAQTMVSRLVIQEQLGSWVMYRLDADGGFVGDTWHPTREEGLYASWQAFARADYGAAALLGLPELGQRLRRLPAHPDVAISDALRVLGWEPVKSGTHALAAYLTAAAIRQPGLALRMTRHAVLGVRHFLGRSSAKNAAKRADYPRELERRELLGMVAGPAAYLRGRWAGRAHPSVAAQTQQSTEVTR